MTLTLESMISAGYLEVSYPTAAPNRKPELALGELEAMVGYLRLEVAAHLQQREAANSPDAKLSLEGAESDLLTALDSIGAAVGFIERDLEWWNGELAA